MCVFPFIILPSCHFTEQREMTALDHAEQWENQEVVELLKAKGAKQKSEL